MHGRGLLACLSSSRKIPFESFVNRTGAPEALTASPIPFLPLTINVKLLRFHPKMRKPTGQLLWRWALKLAETLRFLYQDAPRPKPRSRTRTVTTPTVIRIDLRPVGMLRKNSPSVWSVSDSSRRECPCQLKRTSRCTKVLQEQTTGCFT